MARYIGAAQANILTIHDYAKKTTHVEGAAARIDCSSNLWISLMYTLGKDMLLDEEVLEECGDVFPNALLRYWQAGLSVLSIWLLSVFIILGKEEHRSMMQIRINYSA